MAELVQITCIFTRDHPNPHERIKQIGGRNQDGKPWKLSEEEAIAGIEAGKWLFWVTVSKKTIGVVVATHQGRKYLKTEVDGYAPNNLLNLSECP